jgi:hypothetical protein
MGTRSASACRSALAHQLRQRRGIERQRYRQEDIVSWRVITGDARERLAELDAGSVHTCVTSPPYFGLRDYGTGEWDGGDADCDHRKKNPEVDARTSTLGPNRSGLAESNTAYQHGKAFRDACGKCGATRVDRQIGLEPTPDEYVATLVTVFREVRRVLRDDGCAWVNIGDSFGPGKQLLGIPWKLAFALQQDYYTGTIRDERDRIWLAAMIDAEGCMFIHKRKVGQNNGQGYVRKNDSYGAGLEVSSTDRCIVENVMRITGRGSICEQAAGTYGRQQTIYRWNLRSNECREVIREVYPHLVAKQHEARLILGCPSSGPDAERAHESLKAIHQGGTPDIDFAPPASMFERGWCLRSDVIWAKLAEPDARERHGPADEGARVPVPALEGAALLLRRRRDPRAE